MADTRYQLEGNAPQLYERETVHTLGRPLAELMFAHVSLHAGDRVLDAACGTGIVTRMASSGMATLGTSSAWTSTPACLPWPVPTPHHTRPDRMAARRCVRHALPKWPF